MHRGVSVSVQGGLSLCPGRPLSRGCLCLGAFPLGSLSRGGGVFVQGEVYVWGSVQRVSLSRGLCPGGSLSGRVSVRETPRTVTSAWYASYWNAFLFYIIFPSMCLYCTEMSSFMCYVID